MKRGNKFFTVLLGLLLLSYLPVFAQSKENGAIEGKVQMPDGAPLPGAEVTLTSPDLIGGAQSVVSDSKGRFRFVAMPPGIYTLEAKLEGFQLARREGIRLSVNMTLTVDFAMQVGTIEERVTVRGVMPMVDVKDSQVAVANLTQELIQNLPNTQFVSNIVNLAPGVSQDSAFGGSDNGIQYQLDGVDVSDPELHTAYVFIDYGVVQEVSVSGIGAPAEYDGFTGAVFNTVTKTGGNTFEGMFDSFIQDKSWNSKNSDDPSLTPPAQALYNVHFDIGGPIIKDKLWFFSGAQYYRRDNIFTGFPETSVYHQPRLFNKLTWQPNRDNRLSFFLHLDLYNGNYRGGGYKVAPEATRNQRSPELALNLSYLHIFNDNSFLEAKFAGFTSYYKLIPRMGYDLPGHYDRVTKWRTVNSSTYYHAFRDRWQGNAALSHHADNFISGTHDFKFGIDAEINPTKTEWGYPGGKYFRDKNGQNYLYYAYEGYSFNATNMRVSGYVQDNWSVTDRLKVNPGLRLNFYRGRLSDVGTVFKPQMSLAPRIGVTYDLFGDHSTAFKIHYGKYVDNIITTFYGAFSPKPDWIEYWWNGSAWEEDFRVVWENLYTFDKKISLPYMHQFTIGLERELIRDLSLSLNYIFRKYVNFIDRVNQTGEFEPLIVNDAGYTINAWNQLNPGENKYLVTNVKKGVAPIVGFTPERKYQGFEVVLNKRFSNRWQLLASYVYSKATGQYDNSSMTGTYSPAAYATYSSIFSDPNYQVNLDANSRNTIDPTHLLKIQGTYVLPLDIYFTPYLLYRSGNNYTRVYTVSAEQGDRDVPVEKIGNSRLPGILSIDLQVEKAFKIKSTRLGVVLAIFNLLNDGTETSVGNYVGPDSDIGTVYSIVAPRAFRAGVRLYF